MWEYENFSAWWFSWYAAGQAENTTTNHPSMGAAKSMDKTAAGEVWREGTAAGGKRVGDGTMTKAADDKSVGRQRSRRHNNQPSTEGCSGSVGGNNNGCRNDGDKGNGGSKGCCR